MIPHLGRAGLFCLFLVTVAAGQPVAEDPCEEGRRLYEENNYLAAEPLLISCLEQGDNLLALVPLTKMAVVQGRADMAADYGSRALALDADSAAIRYWFGRALVLQGEPDQAMAQWEAGLVLDLGHMEILEGMARLSLKQGDDAKGYNLLSQLRLQGMDESWMHRLLSDLARRRGMWAQSAVHWRDVVRREGETEENLVILGELTILAGDPEGAVQIFRHAVQVVPTGATYGGLGEAWFAMGQMDSAAVALKQAVELDPENTRNRFNLANALEILGDAEGARQQFQTYIERVPADPMGHFNYSVHLERRGDLEGATVQIEETVRLDPTYIQAQVVLAQLYESAGRTDDVLRVLDDLERLDPAAAGELDQWRARVIGSETEAAVALGEGKVLLRHIIIDDPAALEILQAAIKAGDDFGALATRFSVGSTAVRGGDIGWVNPADMVGPLREAIEALEPGKTSPPVVAGGRTHFFKRIR